MFKAMISSIIGSFKKMFCFKGRATKAEYWIFFLFLVLFNIIIGGGILGIGTAIGLLFESGIPLGIAWFILLILYIPLTIALISLSVRRLHDLGLSGFWLFYLNSFGLPIIFMVYLLDLDKSSNRVVEKISKVGSVWLGWILTFLFWPVGSSISLFLLFLYDGKKEENEFGPAPAPCLVAEKPAE